MSYQTLQDAIHRAMILRPARTEAAPVNQLSPFGGVSPNHRTNDLDTARAAALMDPNRRLTDRGRALAVLREYPDGLTDFELGDLMGRQQTSAGKRRGELVQLGFVVDSGRRRSAPSGAKAIVWRIHEH